MALKTEARAAGSFIVSEANGFRSRDKIIIDTGVLAAGTVLGKVTATGKFVILAPAAADGSQNAAAVLFDAADATAADVIGVGMMRDCELRDADITWPGGITGPQKTTAIGQLNALGIVLR